ncbi:putative sugar transporter [Piedraia hortae CBS 480.64]|uniref:Putative sugar transporter n=1 Tax=Piedraia hortae CBS 480.64 TaxID=1314780 RepID=A0A6A7BY31_9PEZI|nr:putative sugar transporter [Piedraia hortae CBS 480.64]
MASLMKSMNLFAKHDVSEFPGVLISLEEAHHVAAKESKTDEVVDDGRSGSSQPGLTLDTLRAEVEDDLAAGGHDTAYDRKAKVINRAIQDIGMGPYQWKLFVLCGFGWMADNIWLQSVALTLPSVSAEFGVASTHVRYTTMCLFIGLCIGASFWGIASDVIGRRLAFNFTLFLAGVFGLASAGAPSWIGVCALYACVGLGIGGNLPVDGALFLEFLPFASGNLLTLLSVWWPVGQLIASLVAWPLITKFGCDSTLKSCAVVSNGEPCCGKSNNMGWRYFILTMGALTFFFFICRFVFFHLFESPKFLLSRGRQSEAVAVVHGIAYHNKAKTWLTEDILNEIGGHPDVAVDDRLGTTEIIRRSLSKFSTQRVGPLFHGRKLAMSTILIWTIWAAIGMGYPLFNAFLPQYLSQSGGGKPEPPSVTYRNYAITSIVGVPGSIIACFTVEIRYLGRKGTMAISTLITGIFLFLFTISPNPNFQLAFSSLEGLFQNVAYGVLYAYTPEVFPAPNRGSGTGIASFLNRVAGLCAPIIAVNTATANPKSPIYASGALFFIAFLAMIGLPIETRGRQSL